MVPWHQDRQHLLATCCVHVIPTNQMQTNTNTNNIKLRFSINHKSDFPRRNIQVVSSFWTDTCCVHVIPTRLSSSKVIFVACQFLHVFCICICAWHLYLYLCPACKFNSPHKETVECITISLYGNICWLKLLWPKYCFCLWNLHLYQIEFFLKFSRFFNSFLAEYLGNITTEVGFQRQKVKI